MPRRGWMVVTVRVEVAPSLYGWSSERSSVDVDELHRRFPKLAEWEAGDRRPTLKQLEGFARATKTPVGYFFMSEPPEDAVPIPDIAHHRRQGGWRVRAPTCSTRSTSASSDRTGTATTPGASGSIRSPHVGSLTTAAPAEDAAAAITAALSFSVEQRGANWSAAFARLRDRAEACGILVMVSGVVGSNTHRPLDPEEFRGFAPCRPGGACRLRQRRRHQGRADLHPWRTSWRTSGSARPPCRTPDLGAQATNTVERWCNLVAAEVLVPVEALRSDFAADADLTQELERLARRYRSSTLVVLRRIHEAGPPRLERLPAGVLGGARPRAGAGRRRRRRRQLLQHPAHAGQQALRPPRS